MSLGGIVTLFFLQTKAQNIQHHMEEIKSLCEGVVLREMDLKDFEYNIQILKKHTDSKTSTDLPECPSHKHRKSEEILKRNAISNPGSEEHLNETKLLPFEEPFLLGEVNFSVELLKKLKAKELLPIIEAQFQIRKVEWYENLRQLENLRIIQKKEELKKKEEVRQKRDKNEQAFQDYIKKIEQRKKEQAEQRKKIIEEREVKLKEQEERRKNDFEILKKKEETRRLKKLQEIRKKAEEEKKIADEAEKFNKEHLEKQQKAIEEWHRRKKEDERHKNLPFKMNYMSEVHRSNPRYSLYVFPTVSKMNNSFQLEKNVKSPIGNIHQKKIIYSKRHYILNKKTLETYPVPPDEKVHESYQRKGYIKELLNSISHKSAKDEVIPRPTRASVKRIRKETPNRADYKILVIYQGAPSSSKTFGKKSSFNGKFSSNANNLS